ncbi:BlaI/MecI/CopY family transcriptional regulator [Arthrobacter cryoconiti]|uniref:BlaI/MecI/CopY family transcriptional regulator n=1 Tax=Arthrobacter cryoconiti TaxID=748907 RepID=A0ABV8QZ01_9MICC|nr:BlaI/MecI/CopY family transcriptional regulator [Arthrobacter cryoconiti]MCC9067607.1 BlaI/MecI/CopY family transcriptional regulator [Arthrobacter cryoconiti]
MAERRMRGELEGMVMRILWSSKEPLSVRDIQADFDSESQPAVTTLLTVLERLRIKGQVKRGDAVAGIRHYSAAQTEPKLISDAMLATLTESSVRAEALLNFAGNLSDDDVDLLRRALGKRGRSASDQN